jgi:hypothetical protein
LRRIIIAELVFYHFHDRGLQCGLLSDFSILIPSVCAF